MNTKSLRNFAAVSATAVMLAVATPAFATTTLSLTESWTDSIQRLTGNSPTVSTATTSTSNLGTVTPLSNPYTQTLTLNTPTTGEILFVVDPNGSGTANITVNFTFSDSTGGHATASDVVSYYAQTPDTDYLHWNVGAGTNNFNVTLSDGAQVSVNLPNETDWNMAQQVNFTLLSGPTAVPEPASMALLGTGIIGFGISRRRRNRA